MKSASAFEQLVLPLFEQGSNSLWLARARAVAFELGKGGRLVTVDNVRDRCPPPPYADPRIMGAIFVKRYWERVGHVESGRGVNHHRPIVMFRLRPDVDNAKA